MPLRKSKGNMYPWVTHTHSHLAGQCPHGCLYCYVDNPRFGRPEKYKGPIRLLENELTVDYGSGKTIFIENCSDLFASEIQQEYVFKILDHCWEYPGNCYVFQTKNPIGFGYNQSSLPHGCLLGTTLETNRYYKSIMGNAPEPTFRLQGMLETMKYIPQLKRFVSIEPVLDFDPVEFSEMIRRINPNFVSIGADSKRKGLPEPNRKKLEQLIESLENSSIKVRIKSNLKRLASCVKI